jgi:hypothetical protein
MLRTALVTALVEATPRSAAAQPCDRACLSEVPVMRSREEGILFQPDILETLPIGAPSGWDK